MLDVSQIDVVVFDFDGVLTDNRVTVDQAGKESVCCSRSDGLAFDGFRKLRIPTFILSTESNPVVVARARKLQIPVLNSVSDKVKSLHNLCDQNGFQFKKILYVGNDINDYMVMQECGFSACPADAHQSIKQISTIVLESSGGSGVAREILEKVLNVNLFQTLYNSD
ncbi:MAG: HAD hydrolase family protein [Opitutae bacterium]|jgi:3-deoxy-D-manno-octulosonate 8-phosphate phosphatase (KDO 8-P phosphatase)|nr:HAD hydrolase family protein [Opitutae bacterium]